MMYESMTDGADTMALKLKTSKVQEKGQVTIPAEIREQLGLIPGSVVAFIVTEKGVLISRQEIVAMDTLDKIGNLLQQQGVSLDEIIESGRELRSDLIQEHYGLDENEWSQKQP